MQNFLGREMLVLEGLKVQEPLLSQFFGHKTLEASEACVVLVHWWLPNGFSIRVH